MNNGGTRVAEIGLWLLSAAAGIGAVVGGSVTTRTVLIVVAMLLSATPPVIEVFRRRHFANSDPGKQAREAADETWKSTLPRNKD